MYININHVSFRCIRCVQDKEISMLTELVHLQEIVDILSLQAENPHSLPQSSEQALIDLKRSDQSQWTYHVSAPFLLVT